MTANKGEEREMINISLSESGGPAMASWDIISGILLYYLNKYMYLTEIQQVDGLLIPSQGLHGSTAHIRSSTIL